MPPPSVGQLAAVDDAFERVVAAILAITDDDARHPSLLPGWSRGHVLTHLARNADGMRHIAEGAIAGEARAMYPGGADQRAADIDAGAGRPSSQLRDDVERSHAALVSTWSRLSSEEWARPGSSLAQSSRPISESVGWRRRELLVHLVDLDVGVTAKDLPVDFLAAEATWLAEYRPAWDLSVESNPSK